MKEYYSTLLALAGLLGLWRFFSSTGLRAPGRGRFLQGLIIIGGALLLVLLLLPRDLSLLRSIQSLQGESWKKFFRFWSSVADGLVLYPLLATAGWLSAAMGRKTGERPSLAALWAGLSAGLAGQVLKHIFLRARPYADLGPLVFFRFDGFTASFSGNARFISMPSGHTAVIFAVCGALCLSVRSRSLRILLLLPALLTGLSRVWLNSHWPSDIAAGAGLGLFTAWIFHTAGETETGMNKKE